MRETLDSDRRPNLISVGWNFFLTSQSLNASMCVFVSVSKMKERPATDRVKNGID